MRLALVAVLWVALAVPATASAQARNPAVCRRIAQQLVHYDAMKVRAHEEGHDLWVDRFEDHIESLEGHFAEKCPEQAAEQRSIQQLGALLKGAGRAALTFFTLGMY
jgi:hypothetical protein